jgi:hypothetical protein
MMADNIEPKVLIEYANDCVILFGHSRAIEYLRSAALEIDKLREENRRMSITMTMAQSLINDGVEYRTLKKK